MSHQGDEKIILGNSYQQYEDKNSLTWSRGFDELMKIIATSWARLKNGRIATEVSIAMNKYFGGDTATLYQVLKHTSRNVERN